MNKLSVALVAITLMFPAVSAQTSVEANPNIGLIEVDPDSPLYALEKTEDQIANVAGLRSDAKLAEERAAEASLEADENDTERALEVASMATEYINESESSEEGLNASQEALQNVQNKLAEKMDENQTIEFTTFDTDEVVVDGMTVENGTVSLTNDSGTMNLDIPPKQIRTVEVQHVVTGNATVQVEAIDTRGDDSDRTVTTVGSIDNETASSVQFESNATGTELMVSAERNNGTVEIESITVKVQKFDVPGQVAKGLENAMAMAGKKGMGQKVNMSELPHPKSPTGFEKGGENGSPFGNVGKEIPNSISDNSDSGGVDMGEAGLGRETGGNGNGFPF